MRWNRSILYGLPESKKKTPVSALGSGFGPLAIGSSANRKGKPYGKRQHCPDRQLIGPAWRCRALAGDSGFPFSPTTATLATCTPLSVGFHLDVKNRFKSRYAFLQIIPIVNVVTITEESTFFGFTGRLTSALHFDFAIRVGLALARNLAIEVRFRFA
jgi:hypothetical protein